MSKYVIEVENLTYQYEYGSKALEDVSIRIRPNEFVAIIGQNGAGKSTLLKNITGLLRPTSGRILIEGEDIADRPVYEIAHKIGFVLQNPDRQLFSDTVEKEVGYALVNAGMPEKEIAELVEKSLVSVGLQDKREEYPPALSKGDRAKVVVASVIAMNTDVVILDEPTSGQDYRGCYQIMNIARELHGIGKTIVFVTHSMSLVAEYADRTIVMMDKKVLMDDQTCEVFRHTEKLAQTHIKPPQVCSLNQDLRKFLPQLPETVLSVPELGELLLSVRKGSDE